MVDLDLKMTQAMKDKIKKVKERLKGEPKPLTSKDKRRFSKIRNAIRKKTDVKYVK